MKIEIPRDVLKLIERLIIKGYDCYLAGGSVRDFLLGKTPHDFDLATSAHPDEIEEIFKDYHTLDVGKKFGTILVVVEIGNVEITTFRADGTYSDGRKPDGVKFSKSLREDVKRRDFTINAMAYSEGEGIIDYFGGVKDLKNKIIRTVGRPVERFNEDHLRMLRAIRFATTLDFKIEDETFNAIKDNFHNLERVSRERIREEWIKILMSDYPDRGLDLLIESLLMEVVFPNFGRWHLKNLKEYERLKNTLKESEKDLLLRMLLFFSITKNFQDLSGIRATNKEIELIKSYDKFRLPDEINDYLVKKIMGSLNFEILKYILKAKILLNEDGAKKFIDKIDEIIERREPYLLSEIKISGVDIIAKGVKEGREVGRILELVYDDVLRDPKLNEREILLKLIDNYR